MAEGHGGVDPRGVGVDDRDPFAHPVLGEAPVELAAEARQLGAVVDAFGLPDVLEHMGADRQPVGDGTADDVGEVQLALDVVGVEACDRVGEEPAVDGEDAAVHLADHAFGVVGVSVLADGRDGRGVVAHDAAVPARVVELGRQDRDHVAGGAMVVEQLTDRLGGQERHVAIRDQHGAFGSRAQRLERDLDGVAGSALVLLHGQHDLWIDLGDRRRHLVAVVPDDGHGARDAGLADGDQRVRDHAAPGQLVEHLGALRSHPRARARGEDDGGDLFAHSSPCARGLAPAVAAQSIVERGESDEGEHHGSHRTAEPRSRCVTGATVRTPDPLGASASRDGESGDHEESAQCEKRQVAGCSGVGELLVVAIVIVIVVIVVITFFVFVFVAFVVVIVVPVTIPVAVAVPSPSLSP